MRGDPTKARTAEEGSSDTHLAAAMRRNSGIIRPARRDRRVKPDGLAAAGTEAAAAMRDTKPRPSVLPQGGEAQSAEPPYTDPKGRAARSQPADRRDRAMGLRGDPRARLLQRLADHLHAPTVGVQQRFGVAHDADMAFPEDQIAAPQMPSASSSGNGEPSAASIMSLSRGASIPAAPSALWMRPEQSIPSEVRPPQR